MASAPHRISGTTGSWLDSFVKWLRSKTMPEWLKLGGSFIALCAFVWAMLQQHDYRLSKLEDGFEAHLIKHDEQYKDIQKSLRDIDVSLARIYTGQETRR